MKVLPIYAIIGIILLFYLAASCPQRNCRKVRNGEFYFQPKNSTNKYLVIRTDSVQKEVEVNTLDTSYWKIAWTSDCSFTLKFSHRTKDTSIQERTFFASRKLVVEILNVNKDYYSFKAGIDSLTGGFETDTLWINK